MQILTNGKETTPITVPARGRMRWSTDDVGGGLTCSSLRKLEQGTEPLEENYPYPRSKGDSSEAN